jgi:hypothetical protein
MPVRHDGFIKAGLLVNPNEWEVVTCTIAYFLPGIQ